MDVRDQDAAELLQRILEELRALRVEAARQSGLLDATLRKLDGIERSQFS